MACTQALLTPEFLVLTRWRSGPPGLFPQIRGLHPSFGTWLFLLPKSFCLFFPRCFFFCCARSFCCTDRVLLRFLCTYNRSADCVRSARTHHIPSHHIPSHHILYILVLELERTFFSISLFDADKSRSSTAITSLELVYQKPNYTSNSGRRDSVLIWARLRICYNCCCSIKKRASSLPWICWNLCDI